MLLYFRFNICKGGKFIALTVFNCKDMAQKILLYGFCLKLYNIIDFDIFFKKWILFLLSVCVSIYTQLPVVITVKFTMQFLGK